MYEDIEMPAPRLSDPKYRAALPEFFGENSMNRVRYHWRWDTPEKYQANMRAYFRLLSGIDMAVGRVVQALQARGIADNTVIVYMGDNGYMMGDRGMAGKWNHYEQSLRVPVIVYDPRVKQSRVERRMALNIDLAPTFLDWAGAKLAERHQGRSLAGFVHGEPQADWRNDFFCEHLMENAQIPKWEGVRGERYVYARYFEHDYEFLHDLQEDPDELVNHTGQADYAGVLATMRARCDELRDAFGGPYESPVAR